jgi:hypothetical protein
VIAGDQHEHFLKELLPAGDLTAGEEKLLDAKALAAAWAAMPLQIDK